MTDRYRSHEAGRWLLRALLHAARNDALVQDWIDCADLAKDAGLADCAAALDGLAFLTLGRSASSMQRWDGSSDLNYSDEKGRFSVDLAIDELRELIQLRPNLTPWASWNAAEIGHLYVAEGAHRSASRAHILARATRIAKESADITTRTHTQTSIWLSGLFEEISTIPPIAILEHLDLDVENLTYLFVLDKVRQFILTNRDLILAQTTGDPLLAIAAQCHPSGLGPYFNNVSRLIRNAHDVFAFIEAALDGAVSEAETEKWSLLLSAHLKQHQLEDLVDRMADRAMTSTLRHLFARLSHVGRVDSPNIIRRFRDAALDLDDLALAEAAQQQLTVVSPLVSEEWRQLGEIRACVGDMAASQEALERGLQLAPSDEDMHVLLMQVQAGQGVPSAGILLGRRKLRRAELAAFQVVG